MTQDPPESPPEPPSEPPPESPPESPKAPKDPLHGVTLKAIMEDLIARRGWDDLAANIKIRCFATDPSLSSSLKFLRKTAWARARVEELYIEDQRKIERNKKRNRRRAAMRAHRDSLAPEAEPTRAEQVRAEQVRAEQAGDDRGDDQE